MRPHYGFKFFGHSNLFRSEPDWHFSIFGIRICSVLAAALLVVVAAAQPNKASPADATNEVAVIKTSEGDMVVQFWTDAAPNTIENFKKLAKQGLYNGTIFHRIVKGFMIQGGDPNSKDPAKEDSYGAGGPGYKIKAEFNDHSHERGVISMAREPDPDSAGSQFFICLAPVTRLDHQYTTFGKLIKGDEVLEKIGNTAVTRNSMGEMSKPTKRITIDKIDILPADSVK
ncbi:MAG TPA: peptidylprolyl isomerase [Chthoniobacterales bacterium]|nr:peptidylprolyl isomerase [Chthoniobacterales bacterium]